jgi:hypothetical protein
MKYLTIINRNGANFHGCHVTMIQNWFRRKCCDEHNNNKYHKILILRSSPWSETNSRSAGKEILSLFMEPEGSLLSSQEPAIGLYPKTDELSPYTHTT